MQVASRECVGVWVSDICSGGSGMLTEYWHCRLSETARLLKNVFRRTTTRVNLEVELARKSLLC